MAIAKTSGLVAAVSGSVGGVTFSQARSAQVIGQKGRRTRARTALELQATRNKAGQPQAWRDLSDFERSQWNDLALSQPRPNRFGVHRPITGYQLFMFVNQPVSATIPSQPPPIPYQAGTADTTLEIDFANSVTWEIDADPKPDAFTFFGSFYVCRTFRDRPPTNPDLCRWFLVHDRQTWPITPIQHLSFRPYILATAGTPQSGEYVGWRVIPYGNGQYPGQPNQVFAAVP